MLIFEEEVGLWGVGGCWGLRYYWGLTNEGLLLMATGKDET